MKGGRQVIGAPSKGPPGVKKTSSLHKPSSAGSVRPAPALSAEKADEKLAFELHRIVAANLPNLTLVDDVNNLYQEMFHRNFPKISQLGILHGLKSNYDHILNFSTINNKVYCGPANGADISKDDLLALHKRSREEVVATPVPAQIVKPVGAVTSVSSIKPPAQSRAQVNEQTFSYLSQGVRTVLSADPSVGQAANLEELGEKISKSFFEMFRIPIALEAGKILVDPITILRKGEGTLFAKLVEEPVTGRVSVKPISVQKQTSPSSAEYESSVVEKLKRLRSSIVRNLEFIDTVLTRSLPLASKIEADVFANGILTLVDYQEKSSGALLSFFPGIRGS